MLIRAQLPKRWVMAAFAGMASAACGATPRTAAHDAAPANAEHPLSPAPTQVGWCEAVRAALGSDLEREGFRCLPVPNFLVTGFYFLLKRSVFRAQFFDLLDKVLHVLFFFPELDPDGRDLFFKVFVFLCNFTHHV